MALVKCGECGNDISEKAPSCPKCGAPTSSASAPTAPASPPAPQKKRGTRLWAWVILAILILGGAYALMSPDVRNANKPDMPVEVKYRRAITGPGLVLDVRNKSDRQLTLLATFKNPTLHTEKTFQLTAPPHGDSEVGHLEGWSFASGDTISISHNDYKSWTGNIP